MANCGSYNGTVAKSGRHESNYSLSLRSIGHTLSVVKKFIEIFSRKKTVPIVHNKQQKSKFPRFF